MKNKYHFFIFVIFILFLFALSSCIQDDNADLVISQHKATAATIGVIAGILTLVIFTIICIIKGVNWFVWLLAAFGSLGVGLLVFICLPPLLGLIGLLFGSSGLVFIGFLIGIVIGVVVGSRFAGGNPVGVIFIALLGGICGIGFGHILRLVVGIFIGN